MNLRLENSRILLEFSLTQPKRAWKIRKGAGNKKSLEFGDTIEKGDSFEWMLTNEEVRDVVSALRCISPETYQNIECKVTQIKHYSANWTKEIGEGITLEAKPLPKQRKPTELTPFLFVLLRLDYYTEYHYLVDKRGKKIEAVLGHKLRAGDKLIWAIDAAQIEEIAIGLASLDSQHQEMVKEGVFGALSRL